MTMYMFRIEDKNDLGPYHGGDVMIYGEELGFWHTGEPNHPAPLYNPDKEPELYEILSKCSYTKQQQYLYGFKDTKQYCKWFTREEREDMFQYGYRLKKVRVKDLYIGRKQCIGIRKDRLIQEI